MAAKRGSPTSRARKPKGSGAPPARAKRGNVTTGPVTKRSARVPINAEAYSRKESEIAQLEVKVKKLRAKIKPDQVQIAEHRKTISELTEDIEEETEEQEIEVRDEFHWNTQEVVTFAVEGGKEVERRTMTAGDRKRQEDLEDVGGGKGRVGKLIPTNGASDLTPGEAAAAARDPNGSVGAHDAGESE